LFVIQRCQLLRGKTRKLPPSKFSGLARFLTQRAAQTR